MLREYSFGKPFRFWCQKVLPLVYDDSLSYYELLCKVVDYLNRTREDLSYFISNWSNPVVVSDYNDFADTNKIYLYTGDQMGYNKNHWYYYENGEWVDGGLYGSAVVDSIFNADSDNALQNDTITNYLNPSENESNYLGVYTKDGALHYGRGFIAPEMFGAVGDLSADDSGAIKECLDYAVENHCTVVMLGKYLVSNPIVVDADSNKCDVLCYGYIQATEQITLRGFINSNVILKLFGGGNGNPNTPCIRIERGGYNSYKLLANEVNGLAYMVGGSASAGTMTNFNELSVYGWNNLRTLIHGDGINRQWAFGTYEAIYDYNPTYPIRFQMSNDITIVHLENLFTDENHEKDSVEFIDCDLVNIESIAIGGRARYLGYITDSRMHINYVFVNSEDSSSDKVTQGLYITGKSVVNIDYVTSGNIPKAVIVNALVNEAGANWRPQVYIKNGFVYDPSTEVILDASGANSQRVGCYDQFVAPTAVHANISSFTGGFIRIGRLVFIDIRMELSAAISAGGLQVLFSGVPPHDSNFGTTLDISSNPQMLSTSKLGESATSIYLPSGQSLTAGVNYIRGWYTALT